MHPTRAPAGVLAIPLLAGAVAGLCLYEQSHLGWCAAGASAIALIAGVSAFLLEDGVGCAVAVAAGSLVAGASLGASAARDAYAPSLLAWFTERPASGAGSAHIDGVLQEDASAGPFGVSLFVRVSRVEESGHRAEDGGRRVDGGVRLSVAGTLAADRMREWRGGRRISATANLKEPAIYVNPGVPDERRALARRGIVLVGSVKSAGLVEVLAPGSWISEMAGTARAWTRSRLMQLVGPWSARSAGIATAILIGDRTGLDAEDDRRLQDAGTYHVIAISGGNIAILSGLVLVALRLCAVPYRASAAVTILLLQMYGAIVMPAPSVDRAIAAATIVLAGRLLDQRGSPVNVLAVAAVLAVATSPVAAFDPAFVLSFGATFGILVGVPVIGRAIPARSRALRAIAGVLVATLAAEVILAPIGALFFSRVTVAGLLLNFAAIPLMTVIQAASLLGLAVSSVHMPAAAHLGQLAHLAAEGLIESARLVDIAPWLCRATSPPALWLLALYYAAIAVAFARPRFVRAAGGTAATAAIVIFAGGSVTSRDAVPVAAPGSLRVVFIDVGQGDATIVLLPDGRSLLIDTGGFPIPALQDGENGQPAGFDIGERVVAPVLRAFAVRRLDALVLTHGDPDHIGGALSVIRLFRPRALWEGVEVPPHRGLSALAAFAGQLGAERRFVVAGDRIRLGAVQIRVLHPPVPAWERQRVRNEDSVVLEIRLGDVAVVLPGDIGKEGEAAVLPVLDPAPVVILKAPHHGSASSSTAAFLSALKPSAVIFSAGRANHFGHPAPSVVARYRTMDVEMFSTAVEGAVMVDTDGRRVEISGWTGRRFVLTR
jgi:competence protein ComEC